MSENNEAIRSSAADYAGMVNCVQRNQAAPMSDAQAVPTRVAALMRAEAAVVQSAADLIGSAERNGMGVAVLVLGAGGAVLHQLGTPLPDGAWPPQDPESVALSALADTARNSADHDARVAAAGRLLAYAEQRPKLSDPDGIGAMLNGLGYPRHVNGEKLTLAGRVRHALDLAKSNGADDERFRANAVEPKPQGYGDTESDVREAVGRLLVQVDRPYSLVTYHGIRTVIAIGTPDRIRELLDEHEGMTQAPGLAELHASMPGLRFAAERNEAVWIALESGRAFAYGTPAEIASMAGSEQQREVAAAATAEVDAQAEVSIVADLQVSKAQPRSPSDQNHALRFTKAHPHAFRRHADNALIWAWTSVETSSSVCMVEHESGHSYLLSNASTLLTHFTQLTAG